MFGGRCFHSEQILHPISRPGVIACDAQEERPSMANLGYIGLGAMGGRMANRLLDKGHTMVGYNRTRAKAQWLIDRGMTWGESPEAVAQSADMIFVMVTDSASLEAVA